MNTIKKNVQRYGCMLLSVALLSTLNPVSAMAADTDDSQNETVRVGWYEDSYHITGENGERSGYGYEYEQAVAAYTGWNYEYVKGDWAELLEMLQDGEIDMMGALSYTDERAETMLFSELPMGEEKYYLYADLVNTDILASDLSTLNDKRIVVMEQSVQATQFHDWEEKHNVRTKHVNGDSFEKAKEMAAAHEIDGVISTETPAWVEAGMSAVATTGGSDIYYGISKDRPDLKEKLDDAMHSMEADKPFYADELYQRYLTAQSVAVLSSDEKEWMDQHGAIRMGFLSNDPGISMLDTDSGEMIGVINDYIQYAAEQNKLALSNTVMSPNLAAITTETSFDENAENSVAVEKDNLTLKWYISYYYPDWKMVECDSSKDVEKSVKEGQADCFLTNSSQVMDYGDDKKLHSVFLMQPDNISFAVCRGNSTLMSVLNKTLKTMPASKLTGALSVYDNELRKITLVDFIKDNLVMAASVPGQYDLILMDIQMPIMNGYEATRQIRAMKAQHCRQIPILAMTANAFEDDRTLASQAGMNGYLTKPIQVKEMLRTICSML